MAQSKDTILLVDSHALIHRAFHAFPQTLTTKEGELVNAVFGFTSLLLQVLTKFKPKYVVCVFDAPGDTFRSKMYKDYKANRPETDKLLVGQFDRVHEVVEALGIPTLMLKGFEADDLLGTLSRKPELKGVEKIILTGDRDLLQLVNDETKVYLSGFPFSHATMLDIPGTEKKLGFAAPLLTDFKGLRGDTSDNIPGVKGIGDKTATDLVGKYGQLSEIYKHLDELKNAVRKKLEENKEIAELSKQLATIDTGVKINFTLDKAVLDDYDQAKAMQLLQKLEFRSLLNKLPKSSRAQTEDTNGAQLSMMETVMVKHNDTKAITDFSELQKFVAAADKFVLRTDANREDIFAKLTQLVVVSENGTVVAEPSGWTDKDIKAFPGLFKQKLLAGHDVKFDLHALITFGITGMEYGFDAMLAAYVLQSGSGKFDLATLSFNTLGVMIPENPGFVKEAELCFAIYQNLREQFSKIEGNKDANPVKLFSEIEMPIVKVLVQMERTGVVLDKEYLVKFKAELEEKLVESEKNIYKEVGHEFNIASPKQLGEVLFGELNIPGGKKNKSGGYSTNERVLIKFRATFPIIDHILEYRELSKLKSTYTDALINYVAADGRIHTNYKQAVAATGRLSSQYPNLQNIPVSTDLGQKIREAFIVPAKKLFVSFDYSQQELRLLAHFSQEEKLIAAFNSEIDIHSLTASQIFKKPVEEVDKHERRIGKTVNFGVVYGISAFGLSDRLDLDRKSAQDFIDSFYNSYPKVRAYFDNLLKSAREDGYVTTLFGRRKSATGLDASNWQLRAALERELINFPLQGSAADMMKLAMINVEKMIQAKYADFAEMSLQIHDELVFEVATSDPKDKQLNAFLLAVRKEMLDVAKLSVIMKVSAETGKNLGQMTELEI